MLVTNANEVLASDGIHGQIAGVGIGFGTGRHTANLNKRRNLEHTQSSDDEYNIQVKRMETVGVSARDSPLLQSMAVSAFTQGEASRRSKNEQVTEGRFELP